MKFKKLLSIILSMAIVLCSFTTAFATPSKVNDDPEDDIEFPCGGVIEMVDVKILYAPLSSRILIGDYEPDLEGIVLLITYPDGEKEILTVEKKDRLYYAGDFQVYIYFWYYEEPPEYGFVKKSLSAYYDMDFGGYDGDADFIYLYLPSLKDISDLIHSYFAQ